MEVHCTCKIAYLTEQSIVLSKTTLQKWEEQFILQSVGTRQMQIIPKGFYNNRNNIKRSLDCITPNLSIILLIDLVELSIWNFQVIILSLLESYWMFQRKMKENNINKFLGFRTTHLQETRHILQDQLLELVEQLNQNGTSLDMMRAFRCKIIYRNLKINS